MGSPRVTNAKPIPMEATDKKSIKTFIKSFFYKKKEKPKIDKKETNDAQQEIKKVTKSIQNTNTVAAILENFNKLNLDNRKPVKLEPTDDEENEFDNFAFKVIEEPRNERIHSHSSEDSGFSDAKEVENCDKLDNLDKSKNNEESDELADELEKLDIDEEKKKKNKKLQTVVIPRGPIKNKICSYAPSVEPYPSQDQESYRQISQINKNTLTGGQVLVNQTQPTTDNFSEVKIALESVQKKCQSLQSDHETYFQDVMELINEETNKKTVPKLIVTSDYEKVTNIDYETEKKSTYLVDYTEKSIQNNELMRLIQESFLSPEMSNSVEEFGQEEFTQFFNYVQKECNASNDGFMSAGYTYPTPPRSETVPSPMSASPASFCPSNSDYSLSPGRSPIYNCDYEKYQEIPHFEEEKDATDSKERERTTSTSSMTLKQFKDMQKEIVYNFSKRDCCLKTRKSCKELFQENWQKIKMPVRKNLCLEVSKLDLKEAYGVLHNILINLSSNAENEEIQYALFGQVCERMLAQNPAMFVGDAGLSLLKSAALRCPHKPLLTRYLVQSIRTAIKTNASLIAGRDFIFHEVDALGDNLVIACARAGDRCSDVLSELVQPHENQPPLFRLQHMNADGYTALHVACSQHSAADPRLHTVHVLLVHANFDVTLGDLKGGDTALHLAVNSAHCDLQLILIIFNQFERKDWKSLAHCPNLSTKTPLGLAREAAKPNTRQTYPREVFEFLKKCR